MLISIGFEIVTSLLSGRVISGMNWDFIDKYVFGMSLLALVTSWLAYYRYKKNLTDIFNEFGDEIAEEIKLQTKERSVWRFIIISISLGFLFVIIFAPHFAWRTIAVSLFCILCVSTTLTLYEAFLYIERKKIHLDLDKSKT